MDPTEAMRATELGEAGYLHAMFEGAAATDREALGMTQGRFGGGIATVMANDPTGSYWSRVIGLGLEEPVTETVVDDILDFARDAEATSLVFQIAPGAAGPWEEILTERGAVASSAWVKFAGEMPVEHPEAPTDLRIDAIGPDDAAEYAEVFVRGFGMPEHPALLHWISDSAVIPGFRAHGAWDGDRLVAAATSYSADGRTALCGAATDPEARGRGAQSALMVRRFADAAAAGSAWVTCETYVETAQTGPNPSLHNMRRMGLTELYPRRNWVWRA